MYKKPYHAVEEHSCFSNGLPEKKKKRTFSTLLEETQNTAFNKKRKIFLKTTKNIVQTKTLQ